MDGFDPFGGLKPRALPGVRRAFFAAAQKYQGRPGVSISLGPPEHRGLALKAIVKLWARVKPDVVPGRRVVFFDVDSVPPVHLNKTTLSDVS